MADLKKAEKPSKRIQSGFYKDNTVEVTFPDGSTHRVFSQEAEALKKKLATPKFQKMFGKAVKEDKK